MSRQEFITVLRVYPYPPEEYGGVAQNALQSARALRKEGIRVYPAGPQRRRETHMLPYPHFGTAFVKISHDGTRNDVVVASNIAAKRLHEAAQADIVHADEPASALGQIFPLVLKAPKRPDGKPKPVFGATFHSKLEKPTRLNKAERFTARWIPIVETYYGIPIRYRGRLLNILKETFGNRLLAVSHATEEFWQALIPGNFDVLYNGFDTTNFSPGGAVIESWQDGKKTILMAGRHDSRKGLDIGIEAFALLRRLRDDIKLMIAGEGKETKTLQKLVRNLQIPDVSFVGFLPQSELVKAYRTADIFVSPATGGEGFGRVIPEALACGTPVVASNIPGYQEAMREQVFTQAISVGNIEGFAYAIDAFLDLPKELRDVWRVEAPVFVASNFGWPIIAKKQAEIYRRWLREYNSVEINAKHGELVL